MARSLDPNKREQILAAAREVFLTSGYEAARMSDIAAAAGVAVGTLYLYFGSKESLAASLEEVFFQRLSSIAIPGLSDLSRPENIEWLLDSALQITTEEAHLLRMARLPEGRSEGYRRQWVELLAAELERQMKAGVLVSHDPPVLAELMVSLVERAIYECLVWENSDLDRYRKTLISIFQSVLLKGQPNSS